MSLKTYLEGILIYLKAIFAVLCLSITLSLTNATSAQAYTGYYSYTHVDRAIDYVGLPPVFHTIAWRESGDNPDAVNPYSGACGPFQFLPSTAAAYGYTCYDLTSPRIAARAAYELYEDAGLRPWSLTAY